MRNKVFQTQTEAENRRKLEIVLRSLADDRLTARQRRLIACAIGCRRQYRFRLCEKPEPFLDAADTGELVIHQIFGNARRRKNRPAAVLVQGPAQNQEANIVYIYLPKGREEQGDDA